MTTLRFPTVLAAVLLGATACASAPSGVLIFVPPPMPPGPLLPGTACVDSPLPTWQIDDAHHQASLSTVEFRVSLPANWRVTQERPELLVLSGPHEGFGPQAQVELFVSPKCESYDAAVVQRRLAVRSLSTRYKPTEAAAGWDAKKRTWPVTPTGIFRTVISEGSVLMRDAELSMALFYTPIGTTNTEAISFAAGCPRNEEPRRRCEAAYRTLVNSVHFVAPAAATVPPPPNPDAVPSSD